MSTKGQLNSSATRNGFDVYGDTSSESDFEYELDDERKGNDFPSTCGKSKTKYHSSELPHSPQIKQPTVNRQINEDICRLKQRNCSSESSGSRPGMQYEVNVETKSPYVTTDESNNIQSLSKHDCVNRYSAMYQNKQITTDSSNNRRLSQNATEKDKRCSTQTKSAVTDEIEVNPSQFQKNAHILSSAKHTKSRTETPTDVKHDVAGCTVKNQHTLKHAKLKKLAAVNHEGSKKRNTENKMDATFVNESYEPETNIPNVNDSTNRIEATETLKVEDVGMKFEGNSMNSFSYYEVEHGNEAIRRVSTDDDNNAQRHTTSTGIGIGSPKKALSVRNLDFVDLQTSVDSDIQEPQHRSLDPNASKPLANDTRLKNYQNEKKKRRLTASEFHDLNLQTSTGSNIRSATMQYESNSVNTVLTKDKILAICQRYFPPVFAISLLIALGVVYICFVNDTFQASGSNGNATVNMNQGTQEIFTCSLRITNIEYMQSYINTTTKQSTELAMDIENQISALFRQGVQFRKYFLECKILGFEEGSVIALVLLKMRGSPNILNSQQVSDFLKRKTCIGTWKNSHCNGKYAIGKFEVAGESSLIFHKDVCSNSPVIFASKVGFILSSNFGNGQYYEPRQRCEWKIAAPKKSFIRLVFKSFETERYYDVLSIYQGSESEHELIARCSGYIPEDRAIYIPHNNASLLFTSDSMIQKSGFFIVYQIIEDDFPSSAGCLKDDLVLSAPSGGFTSFGYPMNYPNGIRCKWIVSVDKDKTVTFHVRDFQTRDYNDALRIFTSINDKSILFETLYGNINNRKIQTNSHFVVLIFTSNSLKNDRGFHIDYYSSVREGCPGEVECGGGLCIPNFYVCDGTIDCRNETDERDCESGCGKDFNVVVSQHGEIITTMNYPNNYNNDAKCTWQILAENNTHVLRIHFLDFYTELEYDKLQIFNGIGRNKTVLGTFSGSKAPESDLVVPSSTSTLYFTSDSSGSERGFRLFVTTFAPGACPGEYECGGGDRKCISNSWKCDGVTDCGGSDDETDCESGCGGSAEVNIEGYLTSQFFPEKYAHDSECEWRVRTHNDSKYVTWLYLVFVHMFLYENSNMTLTDKAIRLFE